MDTYTKTVIDYDYRWFGTFGTNDEDFVAYIIDVYNKTHM